MKTAQSNYAVMHYSILSIKFTAGSHNSATTNAVHKIRGHYSITLLIEIIYLDLLLPGVE